MNVCDGNHSFTKYGLLYGLYQKYIGVCKCKKEEINKKVNEELKGYRIAVEKHSPEELYSFYMDRMEYYFRLENPKIFEEADKNAYYRVWLEGKTKEIPLPKQRLHICYYELPDSSAFSPIPIFSKEEEDIIKNFV